ncbi:MAG: Na/Pi cotransporter family protein [Bacteroidales bacterium]|nr:Na/Pi cotransporter family protein [Bacteroidales bacterium]
MLKIIRLGDKLPKILLLIFLTFPLTLFARNNNSQEIDWFLVFIGLMGGLALFLFGMEKMSDGLKKTAGDGMRRVLAALTKNKLVGLTVGALVTMFIQSSSATTVMLVSFVNSGLMQFSQSLSIILGANIGTTITAQIIAFKITDYSILFVAIGFFVTAMFKNETIKSIGATILGFGLLFYGMEIMSDAMSPLRTYEPFVNSVKGLDNLYLSILVGVVFTALIQSSSAFIGIVIVMSMQGFVGLYAGIGMILGANIGTCVTAFLSSLKTTRAAKRVAIGHILFKTLGVLFFIFWVPQFEELIIYISKFMNADEGRQIANAHTFFNVINAFVMLPFTGLFAKLIVKILPDKKIEEDYLPKVRHLDYNAVSNSAVAVSLARAEIANSVRLTNRMLKGILDPFFQNKIPKDTTYQELTLIESVKMREEKIDFLEIKITEYLSEVSKNGLTKKQAYEVFALITTIHYLESIADIIIDDILPLIPQKLKLNVDFSEEGKLDLHTYYEKIRKQLTRLEEYFSTNDLQKATKAVQKWEKYKKLELEYRVKHYQRMSQDEHSMRTHKIHMELLDYFQQIGFKIDSIAILFN